MNTSATDPAEPEIISRTSATITACVLFLVSAASFALGLSIAGAEGAFFPPAIGIALIAATMLARRDEGAKTIRGDLLSLLSIGCGAVFGILTAFGSGWYIAVACAGAVLAYGQASPWGRKPIAHPARLQWRASNLTIVSCFLVSIIGFGGLILQSGLPPWVWAIVILSGLAFAVLVDQLTAKRRDRQPSPPATENTNTPPKRAPERG
jgi:hypothetical protein